MLLSLPLELLRKIGNETARLQDRKNLRRTCSLFGEAFKSHVLAEVTLNIYNDHWKSGLGLLKVLADERALKLEDCIASKHIRTLYIVSLTPSCSPESDLDFEKTQGTFKYTHNAEQVKSWVETGGAKAKLAESQLRMLLAPALESLRRLDIVRWHWHRPKQSDWTLRTVITAISAPDIRHNIREFSFHCDWDYSIQYGDYIRITGNIPVSLPSLPKLQILSICAEVSDSVFTAINQPIILTTSLTSLSLCTEGLYWAHIPSDISLENTSHPTMTNLGLSGLVTDVPQVVLKNLTMVDLRQGSQASNSSWDALWVTLSLEQIQLRSLVVSRYHGNFNAILDYIQSYSGLEVLSLISPGWHNSRYDDAADRFYRDALPKHEKTLLKLELKPVFVSRWCFGEHNVDVFRRCVRLRSLWVRVGHQGLEDDPSPRDERFAHDHNPPGTFYKNPVHILLDTVPSALPDLEKLTIEPARDSQMAHDHADYHFGPLYCLATRRRIYASVKSFALQESSATEVLKWVKVFVWNDRVVLTDNEDGETAEKTDTTSVRKKLTIGASRFFGFHKLLCHSKS